MQRLGTSTNFWKFNKIQKTRLFCVLVYMQEHCWMTEYVSQNFENNPLEIWLIPDTVYHTLVLIAACYFMEMMLI